MLLHKNNTNTHPAYCRADAAAFGSKAAHRFGSPSLRGCSTHKVPFSTPEFATGDMLDLHQSQRRRQAESTPSHAGLLTPSPAMTHNLLEFIMIGAIRVREFSCQRLPSSPFRSLSCCHVLFRFLIAGVNDQLEAFAESPTFFAWSSPQELALTRKSHLTCFVIRTSAKRLCNSWLE